VLSRSPAGPKAPARRKARFDAIRAQGLAAVPVLIETMEGDGAPESRLTAINALEGLRTMSRVGARLLQEGQSIEAIASRFGVPRQTIEGVLAAGAWPREVTERMVRAAGAILDSNASRETSDGALSALYCAGDESDEAVSRLVTAATGGELRERALEFASSRLKGGSGAALLAVAADPAVDPAWRMRVAAACVSACPDARPVVEREWLASAQAIAIDATASAPMRGAAVELVAQAQGAASHELMVSLLSPGGHDEVRCAAVRALWQTQGVERGREAMSALASEREPSAARLVAQRVLRWAERRLSNR
jgi:hypothetical protein